MEPKKDAAKKAEELQNTEEIRELAEEELNQVAGGGDPDIARKVTSRLHKVVKIKEKK